MASEPPVWEAPKALLDGHRCLRRPSLHVHLDRVIDGMPFLTACHSH